MRLPSRIVLVTMLLAGSSAAGEVHTDGLHGFRIEVPEGWSSKEQQSGETFVFTLLPPGSAGGEAVTLRIFRLAEGGDAAAGLKLARDTIKAGDGYSDYEEWEGELAGRKAPGLRVRYRAGSGDYRIVQSYVAENGRAYQLQQHAATDDFDARAKAFEEVVASFALVPIDEAARAEEARRALAARCGSELAWADDWDDAARRGRKEHKPILVVAYLLSSFKLGSTPRTALFMDEDLIALVNERYVPLWYTKGSAPVLEKSYGLSGTSFGQALLLATPEGEVFLETQEARQPDLAYAFLRAGLAARPKLVGLPVPGGLAPLERAERLIDRGELERARTTLAGDESAAAHRLLARILRLERDGTGALAELTAARAADAAEGGALADELRVDEAALLARDGRVEEARANLEQVLASPAADDDTRLQARFFSSMLDLVEGDLTAARERWTAIIAEAPEHRIAWKCAAALDNDMLELGLKPDLGWPDDARLAELLAFPTPAPVPASRAAAAERDALEWLLAAQRPDGSWFSPREHGRVADLGPDPLLDATTALAARALLVHCDEEGDDEGSDERVGAAFDRALSYLLASVALREEVPPLVLFMDYMTWSDGCLLALLADAVEAGRLARETAAPVVAALLADLEKRRVPGGGWSYYVTTDLSGDGAPAQSISFTTANAVLGLARARDAGFEVPAELLDAGVATLDAMRDDEGVFSYFLYAGAGRAASTPAPGAVGRGPACELALLRAGAGDQDDLERSLELFFTHDELFAREQGKVVMHAGPDGQGCHYLFFDYAHAAMAHAELGGRDKKTRTRLRELVLACRQPDGAFLDTPLLGRAYGTAMALLALDAL